MLTFRLYGLTGTIRLKHWGSPSGVPGRCARFSGQSSAGIVCRRGPLGAPFSWHETGRGPKRPAGRRSGGHGLAQLRHPLGQQGPGEGGPGAPQPGGLPVKGRHHIRRQAQTQGRQQGAGAPGIRNDQGRRGRHGVCSPFDSCTVAAVNDRPVCQSMVTDCSTVSCNPQQTAGLDLRPPAGPVAAGGFSLRRGSGPDRCGL